MTENERIIQMLIELREQHGLTQTAMADKIGMARNNYSRLESGKHQISLPKLAEILDIFNLQIQFIEKPHWFSEAFFMSFPLLLLLAKFVL